MLGFFVVVLWKRRPSALAQDDAIEVRKQISDSSPLFLVQPETMRFDLSKN